MPALAEVYDIEDYTNDGINRDIKKPVFKIPANADTISAFIPTSTTATATRTATATATATVTAIIDDSITKKNIDIRELYPLTDELNPALGRALSLLEEGIKCIDDAINMIIEKDLISSDDLIQRFQALIPELFCCRSLGDGFGVILVSLHNSLKNLQGVPASLEQLNVIKKVTSRIFTEPFIVIDEAVDEIILFEKVGLIPESSNFKYAADLLID